MFLFNENGIAQGKALTFSDDGFCKGFGSFARLAREWVGDQHAVVSTVTPTRAGVLHGRNDQDTHTIVVVQHAEVIDPPERLASGTFFVLLAAVVDNCAAVLDGDPGQNTEAQAAFFLVTKTELARRIRERRVDFQKQTVRGGG